MGWKQIEIWKSKRVKYYLLNYLNCIELEMAEEDLSQDGQSKVLVKIDIGEGRKKTKYKSQAKNYKCKCFHEIGKIEAIGSSLSAT